MNAGVIVFPGSNCDKDTFLALSSLEGITVRYLWHDECELNDVDFVVLPGGFSYGDYLRTGAFARFSPIMRAVADFASSGGLVLGICNGFQILLEAGLLPGAMLANNSLRFICDWVNLRIERTDMPFTCAFAKGDIAKIPIAHFEGNFFAQEEDIQKIESDGLVFLRYCDEHGNVIAEANPNGSINNIAGLANHRRNVAGMMPHPERASEGILGSEDGRKIFQSVLKWKSGELINE